MIDEHKKYIKAYGREIEDERIEGLLGRSMTDGLVSKEVTERISPSDIFLEEIVCPRCGFGTSGYLLDRSTGNYNFFCSCCNYDWECKEVQGKIEH